MANEIKFGYVSGRTLTYGSYQPDGTVRQAAGTTLTETGTTGYYRNTGVDATTAGDTIIIKDSVLGVVGQGVYEPLTSTLATTTHLQEVEDKLDIVDTNVDTILSNQSTVFYSFDETGGKVQTVPTVAMP